MSHAWLLACAGLLAAGTLSAETSVSGEAQAPASAAIDSATEETGSSERFGVSLDRQKPLEIRSDEFEAIRDAGSKRFIFRKNVEVTQADVVIRTQRLDAFYAPGAADPDRLEASGDVVVTQGDREVRCEHATYHRDTDLLVCKGSAELRDGADRVWGEVIEFDLARETVVVTGGARLELHPRPEPSPQGPPE